MSELPAHGVALLDVNFLVALVLPNHVSHRTARSWFTDNAPRGWASTPFTESGFVRVCSNRGAVVTATTPATALELLSLLTAKEGHHFWPDHVEAVVGAQIDPAAITTHQHVTDAHLLALAVAYGGHLVTFDQGIASLGGDTRHLRILES